MVSFASEVNVRTFSRDSTPESIATPTSDTSTGIIRARLRSPPPPPRQSDSSSSYVGSTPLPDTINPSTSSNGTSVASSVYSSNPPHSRPSSWGTSIYSAYSGGPAFGFSGRSNGSSFYKDGSHIQPSSPAYTPSVYSSAQYTLTGPSNQSTPYSESGYSASLYGSTGDDQTRTRNGRVQSITSAIRSHLEPFNPEERSEVLDNLLSAISDATGTSTAYGPQSSSQASGYSEYPVGPQGDGYYAVTPEVIRGLQAGGGVVDGFDLTVYGHHRRPNAEDSNVYPPPFKPGPQSIHAPRRRRR